MHFDVDLATVPSRKPLPAGAYIVRITKVDVKPSKAGNQKICIDTDVLLPEGIKAEIPKWYTEITVSEAGMWRVKELYEAAERLTPGKGFSSEDLLGAELGVIVSVEDTAEWGERNRVHKWLRTADTTPSVAA